MKAWVLEKQGKVETKPLIKKEIPVSEVRKNEIRIKIKATGICRTDLHEIEGDLPLHKKPVIPGHQIVGIVDEIGKEVTSFKEGELAGAAWLYSSCGSCKFCVSGRENLCPDTKFTGWDVDGGYTEFIVIDADFAYHLGENHSFAEQVPFMCAGITGYRGYRLAEIKKGEKLGLFGFGPTAAFVLQIAKAKDIECFVATRSEHNQKSAKELKADWVGDYDDKFPVKLDAAIFYPPAGELISYVLSLLEPGGKLILSPIYMSPIEIKDYTGLLWMERNIKSVANITRKDGIEFLKIADELKLKSRVETYNFDDIPETLIKVSKGEIDGTAVVELDSSNLS
ncbi:zinc-dependent alcohol dehydrogenase family protein [candidate division WOR-3 bacterium]|nr:zinc-dependent alcohol dehydrogenase family protein [candidate division WOR-3 bacterium]